jgi:hypothetical protein
MAIRKNFSMREMVAQKLSGRKQVNDRIDPEMIAGEDVHSSQEIREAGFCPGCKEDFNFCNCHDTEPGSLFEGYE